MSAISDERRAQLAIARERHECIVCGRPAARRGGGYADVCTDSWCSTPRIPPAKAFCFDCGREYGDEHGFPDLVVAHDIWNRWLSPVGGEGGLLCPSCMCKRAYLAGLRNVRAEFQSGPFARWSTAPTPEAE